MSIYNIPVYKVSNGKLTRQQICDRLENIDNIITKIETALLSTDSTVGIVEYELDTGQTEMRVKLDTTDKLANSLETFQLIRDRLAVKLTPRVAQLVPSSSIRNNNF